MTQNAKHKNMMEMARLIAVILSIVLQTRVDALDYPKRLGGKVRAGSSNDEVSSQKIMLRIRSLSPCFLTFWCSSLFQGVQEALGPQTRIVGGDDVETNERYPYMVYMRGTSMCGGVLIGPDIVLSAAHVSTVLR
jgi:hypothetical protein